MNWLDTPLAAALARALMHFVWEAALIAALLFVMLLALRNAAAQSRYLAACAAMLAMVASFVVTVAGPGSSEPRLVSPVTAPLRWLTQATPSGPAAANPRPIATWAVALWLLGVAVLLLRRAGGWLAARRMLARAVVAADDHWIARLDALRRRMGIPRAVALVESALAGTPAVMGCLRPVILAPAGWLMGLPVAQAEAVLLHELAHIRRHDYLVNLLQSVVEDLLFYHPAVWWVGRVMRRERENCCDDVVLAMGGDRREYARTLASLEGVRACEPVLAASGGSLADRIRRLARPPAGPRASVAPLFLAMALVCAGAIVLPALQTPPPSPAPPPPPVPAPVVVAEAPSPQQPNPYQKWFTEDVAYIIQDEERAAFRRLTTDEELEHFIEQFWARRGTDVKEEHYRRIAYANQNFADWRGAGWKTDRGRTYIVYGPPDEKESHPNGEAGGPPYEDWMYRKFQGGDDRVMRFMDLDRDGRYLHVAYQGVIHGMVGQRGFVKTYPKVRAIPRSVSPALPAVQSNGDYLFASDGLSVRIGVNGATLITADAAEARLTLNRVTRHDGGGEAIFQELTRTKLLTLEPGVYRIQAEMTGESASAASQRKDLETQMIKLQTELETTRQMYLPSHPKVLKLDTQIANLQALLASTAAQHSRAATAAIEFRVP